MLNKYYLTTPLYYVNSKPHIGHSYTQIAADTLARFKRLAGSEVLFLTGTDEHGQKVAKASEEAKLPPKEFTDKIVGSFKELWRTLFISYDDFIRTTEERHIHAVQSVWKKLSEKGEIYEDIYSGFYCTPCETFWTERQVLVENGQNLCPDCKRGLEKIEEKNYFLKLSKHQEWLTKYIRDHENFILPGSRRNEVLGFLEHNSLQDLCISRPKSRLSWGIPSPISEAHVTYVWFDALINYITACGYPAVDEEAFKKWWPADVHIIGKDILRHHAVYWPILLKALDLEPPKMIFAHGWWVKGGEKMSKSRGNVVDPVEIVKRYGVDAYRYFLMKEVSFGFDGIFSEEALVQRINGDLANDLGNLLHRTLTMTEKYFGGKIPEGVSKGCDAGSQNKVNQLPEKMARLMDKLSFSEVLAEIWVLISDANKKIEEKAPWKLFKENKTRELELLMVELLEVLKAVAVCLWPFMPGTGEAIWKQLGIEKSLKDTTLHKERWGYFEKGGAVKKTAPLFPRIETK